jgi:ABC-type Fe3+-hydroxamate transport system substrate-binding protein
MLFACGAESNLAGSDADGDDSPYLRVTLDEIIAAQPDLILLPTGVFEETDVAEVSRLFAGTPALQRGQIQFVDGSLLTWPGTRIAYALRDLPPLIATARV